jgi:cysteine synthase
MRYDTILDAIGNTPMVRLNRLTEPTGAAVWVKLECLNPGGSVKARAASAMIRAALRSGALSEDGSIVEATSGNLGIALAMIGSVLGYPVKIMIDPRTPAPSVRGRRGNPRRPRR